MPTAVIQDGLTVDDNERAVIEKYGFEVGFVDGSDTEMRVTDPVIRDSGNPDNSSFSGEDLEKLLRNAVDQRKAHDKANGSTPPKAGKAAKPAKAATTTKEKGASTPGTIKGAKKLDNSGAKEKRTKKVKEPRVRKDSRYLRATRVIVGNVGINAEDLAVAVSGMSPGTASYCLEAWVGVTLALKEKGWLSKAALDTLYPAAKKPVKAEKPAADA